MAIESAPGRSRSLGVAAVVLGLLGLACYWWVPLGMVLSLTGLVLAIVGWVSSSRLGTSTGLIVAAFILCAAALALDLLVAVRGWEIIHLIPYR